MPEAPLGPVYARVIGSLRAGWGQVRRGSPMAGADGVSLRLLALQPRPEDSVRCYRLCAACQTNADVIGRGDISEAPAYFIA